MSGLQATTSSADILAEQKDTASMDVQTSGEDETPTDEDEHKGKRVKVYELRDSSWFDRGTGYCKGVYDETQDLALLLVEAEELPIDTGDPQLATAEPPGGFLKEDLLLSARVEKDDIYARQQDTLIVWTEPSTSLDIALSFQDADGCEDVWRFICDVQRHYAGLSETEVHQVPSSSPTTSPVLMVPPESRITWQPPTLANIKDQEMWLRMQAKSGLGRERAVEHIIGEDYIKALIVVLNQAEDLESLDDLHALCSLMQTILMLNDNTIFEHILQDEIFMGVIGMLEYDPEFPNLKASYRQFLNDSTNFREVVPIEDENIRQKIHQTYRLLYLKDVVLARVLDDPTFGILNGAVFFNQVDIITYIQGDQAFLRKLFAVFTESDEEKKKDGILFLHQLMLMGKGVQVPTRLALYRNLMEKGLLSACEWALKRTEPQILHAGAEILTLAVEQDVNSVRMRINRNEETLLLEIINLLTSTKNLGLVAQMSDTMRSLLDAGADDFPTRKEGPISEQFNQYFWDACSSSLFQPLLQLEKKETLPRYTSTLLQNLVELLSFCLVQHAHRSHYFILSSPIATKVVSLLHVREKPLRHAVLRFIKASLKTHNHFIHRYFVKNDLLLPLLDMLSVESARDNMLSSASMDILEIIRKENMKPIINYLFEKYTKRLEELGRRPYLRSIIQGLIIKWEQNNEPPPVPQEAESSKTFTDNNQEDYFNGSDDEKPSRRKRGAKRKPDLGLDYDDTSDPEPSPVDTKSDVKSKADLEEDLADVALKMRAKRAREEEEEEGFAGLIPKVTTPAAPKKEKDKEETKKIRLGFGSKPWGR